MMNNPVAKQFSNHECSLRPKRIDSKKREELEDIAIHEMKTREEV